jgi:hypothetical protein
VLHEATIRAAAPVHDETRVRLPLEAGEEAVRRHHVEFATLGAGDLVVGLVDRRDLQALAWEVPARVAMAEKDYSGAERRGR